MALQRGFNQDTTTHDGREQSGPRTFYMKNSQKTTVVLLDDDPVVCRRHQLFIKGDKRAAKMRLTCASPNEADDAPRLCLACNKALHLNQIGRRFCAYLTLIDERQFQYKGRSYQDMKLLLELDKKGYDLFRARKERFGRLAGYRFEVYRSAEQSSARYGDDWTPLGPVDLVRHFWQSPAVPRIIEAEQKRGNTIQHQEAVQRLVLPYNYEEEIGEYTASDAARFVAYVEGVTGNAAQQQGQGGVPPMPPPATGAAAPDYGVPSGQVPQYPQQPAPASQAPQQQPVPAHAGQPPAPAAPPAPPPDPTGARAPPGQYQPAPMPQQPPQQGVPAAPAPAPAPATAPVPNAQAPAAVEQGWSPTPPFPPQQHPAPPPNDAVSNF